MSRTSVGRVRPRRGDPRGEAVEARLVVVVARVEAATRRRRVREVLEGWGRRIGRDAYEILLGPGGMPPLLRALAAELEDEDDVRVLPICRGCRRAARLFGRAEIAERPRVLFL